MPNMKWNFTAQLERFGPGSTRAVSRAEAAQYCRLLARSHYENFSVASLLLPRRLHRSFYAVYAYCRWSDDLADETGGGQRALDLLEWWRGELLACYVVIAVVLGREMEKEEKRQKEEEARRFDAELRSKEQVELEKHRLSLEAQQSKQEVVS